MKNVPALHYSSKFFFTYGPLIELVNVPIQIHTHTHTHKETHILKNKNLHYFFNKYNSALAVGK